MKAIPLIYKIVIGAALTFILALSIAVGILLHQQGKAAEKFIEIEQAHFNELEKQHQASIFRSDSNAVIIANYEKKFLELTKQQFLQDSLHNLKKSKHHEKINFISRADANGIANILTDR